jgi:hypothetical protein
MQAFRGYNSGLDQREKKEEKGGPQPAAGILEYG